MQGLPGSVLGGEQSVADQAFPPILKKSASKAALEFGSKPGAKLKNMA